MRLAIYGIVSVLMLLLASFIIYTQTDLLTFDEPKLSTQEILPSPTRTTDDVLDYISEAQLKSETGDIFDVKIINGTFLNNEKRNYYGDKLPDSLQVIWRHRLGSGTTRVNGEVTWSGAGWTGQPLMVEENGTKYLIQGAYDHHLKKITADSGKLVWQYKFDDVLKGTGTLWINPNAPTLEEKLIIMQGSRWGGVPSHVAAPSYRAVSYFTGKELWRMGSVSTRCYSRDVDASCLVIRDTAYIGLENGFFTVFNPAKAQATNKTTHYEPFIYKQSDTLYNPEDAAAHGGNLVTEASPTRLGNRIYIASGSGTVWGYNIQTQTMDWAYKIGSDMDGSPVATSDSCLLIAVEKQFIKGKGGVLKIDPRKSPEQATVWYFPTEDKRFADWLGGIIGSVSTNEATKQASEPSIAAFTAIDGFLYVININDTVANTRATLFDGVTKVATPRLLFKYATGAAISTPIIIGNRLLALTYNGLYLFEHNGDYQYKLLAHSDIRGEATPFVDNGRIYVASRDGYLYCLGNKPADQPTLTQDPSAQPRPAKKRK